jgi:hypothetical protein
MKVRFAHTYYRHWPTGAERYCNWIGDSKISLCFSLNLSFLTKLTVTQAIPDLVSGALMPLNLGFLHHSPVNQQVSP